MYNWSVDTKFLKKYTDQFRIWKLEQLINYGLGVEKIDLKDLKKYFNKITIDPRKKDYLSFLLKNS